MISIIIPTFNRSKILEKTLSRLKIQTYDKKNYEIIVVDDGSSEDIASIVENCKLPVEHNVIRLCKRSHNGGKPRNAGANIARGDILLFQDCDRLFFKDTLERHRESVPDNMSISLGFNLEPKQYKDDWPLDISQIDLSQFQMDYREAVFGNYCLKEEFPFVYCNTNHVALSRSLFDSVGGFDESFNKWGFEDNELGYRLWKNGINFIFNKQAVAIHHPHLQHTFTRDPYMKMGVQFLRIHPVFEVEASVFIDDFDDVCEDYNEYIRLGRELALKLDRCRPANFKPIPIIPDILLGASEMPGQKAGIRISLCEEDNPDMRLLGIRLPYDDQAVKTLLVSAFWRFLPLQVLNQVFSEIFRVSSRILIQSYDSTDRLPHLKAYWKGDVNELRLIGSDYFDFNPMPDCKNIFEMIRI